MMRLRAPLLSILSVTLLATWIACAPAEARGKPGKDRKSYVERLQPEELAALRKKLPNWDKLDRRKQEGIARGVIRVRNLSPEQRAKLQERMKRLKERGKRERRFRAEMMGFARSVGESVWKGLPESFRTEITKRRIRPSMAMMVLFHYVNGRIAAIEGRAFETDDIAAFPEKLRKNARRLAAVLADPEADEKAKRGARSGLGHMRAHLKIDALKNSLTSKSDDGRIPVERITAALRKTWPEAFDGLARDVAKNPARFAEALERRGRRGLPGARGAGFSSKLVNRREFAGLVMQLERAARQNWTRRPAMQRAADQLIRQVLVQELKADSQTVEALPGFDRPKEREQAIRGLVGKFFKRDGRRGPR